MSFQIAADFKHFRQFDVFRFTRGGKPTYSQCLRNIRLVKSDNARSRSQHSRARTTRTMRLSRRTHWIRWPAGATLALLAAILNAPSSAHASCGDYLMAGAHPAMSVATGTAPDSIPVIPAPHAPCSGPTCSGRAPLLPVTPPAPAPVSGEQWGCAVSLPALQGPGFTSCVLETDTVLPTRCPNSIYHPPRVLTFSAV